ncbi:MAG: hypothetical protein ABI564_15645 [Ideonella sp.]
MISRSTIFALVFACIATLSLAVVAKVQRANSVESGTPVVMVVYQMPRVVVSGRIAAATNGAQSDK